MAVFLISRVNVLLILVSLMGYFYLLPCISFYTMAELQCRVGREKKNVPLSM